jgi:hypothetical protein
MQIFSITIEWISAISKERELGASLLLSMNPEIQFVHIEDNKQFWIFC